VEKDMNVFSACSNVVEKDMNVFMAFSNVVTARFNAILRGFTMPERAQHAIHPSFVATITSASAIATCTASRTFRLTTRDQEVRGHDDGCKPMPH
jgi:hypothetical protein